MRCSTSLKKSYNLVGGTAQRPVSPIKMTLRQRQPNYTKTDISIFYSCIILLHVFNFWRKKMSSVVAQTCLPTSSACQCLQQKSCQVSIFAKSFIINVLSCPVQQLYLNTEWINRENVCNEDFVLASASSTKIGSKTDFFPGNLAKFFGTFFSESLGNCFSDKFYLIHEGLSPNILSNVKGKFGGSP